MADNNQDNDFQKKEDENEESEGFKVSNQAQNLGGGKGREGGQEAGKFADDDDFEMQTDQSIAQAAPGMTGNSTTQGGSNV
ncbi:MAG: hypothetical protein WA584_04535 [Pyrinomonadaceae bacterium]